MPQRLEQFGRYQFDPHGSGVTANVFTSCVIPFLD
jgi:hypothetical protein